MSTMWIIVLLMGAVSTIALIWWAVSLGKAKEKADAQRKELDAFEDEMERIGRANAARRRAESGGVPDKDPYRRD